MPPAFVLKIPSLVDSLRSKVGPHLLEELMETSIKKAARIICQSTNTIALT